MIGRKEMINKELFYFGMYLTMLDRNLKDKDMEMVYMLESRTTISRTLERYEV